VCGFLDITSKLFAFCIQATTSGGFVESPYYNSTFEAGMNVYLEQKDVTAAGDDYIGTVLQLLDRLEQADVNSVSLTWPVFTDGRRSSVVFEGVETPSKDALATFSAVAQARGFGVLFHPILDEASIVLSGPEHWRGTISPWEVDSWFESYTALMVDYAEIAHSTGADSFIIAAELTSMEQHADHWRTVISQVRDVYPDGKITYASNRGVSQEFPWDAVDYIGVDAFFDLDVPVDASVEQMTTDLLIQQKQILLEAKAVGLPLVFTEVGTTAQAGSFRRSWVWDHQTRSDHLAQARYYQAVCDVWKEHLQGIYWWKTTLYPVQPKTKESLYGFNPFGKTAENVVRSCF